MGSIPIPGTNPEPMTIFRDYLREVKRLAPTTSFNKVRVIRRLQKRARECNQQYPAQDREAHKNKTPDT